MYEELIKIKEVLINRKQKKHVMKQATINHLMKAFYHYYLLSTRSVLFPTSTIITSLPLSLRTSSIHFDVFRKV